MQYEVKIRNPLNRFLKIICFIVVFVLVHVVMMLGINCADTDNCLRSWCKMDWLRPAYREYITKNCARDIAVPQA